VDPLHISTPSLPPNKFFFGVPLFFSPLFASPIPFSPQTPPKKADFPLLVSPRSGFLRYSFRTSPPTGWSPFRIPCQPAPSFFHLFNSSVIFSIEFFPPFSLSSARSPPSFLFLLNANPCIAPPFFLQEALHANKCLSFLFLKVSSFFFRFFPSLFFLFSCSLFFRVGHFFANFLYLFPGPQLSQTTL